MRAVVDTNIIVSGLLWHGAPRKVLDAARQHKVSLFTSPKLLLEFEDVLRRKKFNERLLKVGLEAGSLVRGFISLASVIRPAEIKPVVLEDPDDDAVLACAEAANAELIVSGDSHLLSLQQYGQIRIVSALNFLEILGDDV
jgi:putative PIN family toxin of toxin-antitoxin system